MMIISFPYPGDAVQMVKIIDLLPVRKLLPCFQKLGKNGYFRNDDPYLFTIFKFRMFGSEKIRVKNTGISAFRHQDQRIG